MCDWAIGSDTGGSIRIRAWLCGVVGFKPALGTIELTGVVPVSWSLDTVGPMAPDVASAARAFSMMSRDTAAVDQLAKPRLAVPAGWVTGLDEPTDRAWRLVSDGLPEVRFVDRDPLFRNGLTILLCQAAPSPRRRAGDLPGQYGTGVL